MKHVFFSFLLMLIIATTASAQWFQTNGPYGAGGIITCLAVSGTNLFAGTDSKGSITGEVFHSTNDGGTWTAITNGLRSDDKVLLLAASSTHLFALTEKFGVSVSTDNGGTWVIMNNGLGSIDVSTLTVSGANVFLGGRGGVFRSTNNGGLWKAMNNGLTNTNVRTLTASGTNLFAGTSGGGVFLSTNNGNSWTEVNNGLTNKNVQALAVSGTNLFAGTAAVSVSDTSSYGLFYSTNNGDSWIAGNSGVGAGTRISISNLAVSGTNIFATEKYPIYLYSRGVFLSTNNGLSWTETGLSNSNVRSLVVSGTNLFAGVGSIVYRLDLTEISSVSDTPNKNPETELMVSPNPGSGGTVELTYSVGEHTQTELFVTDIHGRTMANIATGEHDTGTHRSTLTTSGWAEGVYMVVLRTPRETVSQKFMVVR
ncbi:MAG: T9SS type A sorting domain-containing protein [Candidatus Kapabacteria bacterium]|nr:T9SS type A sorting domain-containing protein [Candidatus Kapabacteria bacterium]